MRNKVLYAALCLIFPIVFNVVFFVVRGTGLPLSVWLSYGWIHGAYLILVLSPLFAGKSLSGHLFKSTCWQVALAYFVAELIAGIVFIVLSSAEYQAALIVQLVLLAVFMIAFICVLIANGHTADSEQRSAKEIGLIKTMAARVKLLMDGADDSALKKALEHLYDEIHASPAKSADGVKFIENSIMNMISELETALSRGDKEGAQALIKKLEAAVAERNRTLMYL